MASLIKQSGRYYLQFWNKNRKPKRKRVALKTTRKRPARVKKRELEDAYAEGAYDPWTDDPFDYREKEYSPAIVEGALEAFLEAKREDGLSEYTVKDYRYKVGLFARQVGPETPLDGLSRSDVEAYVKDPSLARSSLRRRYLSLSAFFKWCRSRELMKACPLENVEPAKEPEKMPKAVKPEDLERIEATMRRDYREKLEKSHCRAGEIIWQIPLFWFALYTGMRISELARLRFRHLDCNSGLIRVLKQKNRKEQTIPLSARAAQVLENVPEGEPEDFVFRNPNQPSRSRSTESFRNKVSKAFTRYRKKAGIERALTFHGLRHGFCTLLAEAGKSAVVIKEAARHADISTSMRYVHMANRKLRTELDDAF